MKNIYKEARPHFLTDPEVFAVNRLEARSNHKYYNTIKEAKDFGHMDYQKSLNGIWQFNVAKNAESRIKDFYKLDYNSEGWDSIQVPAHIQFQGYDMPRYTNIMYAWDGHNEIHAPEVPEDNNTVGSYIRTFEVPKDWKDSPVYLSFQGVESAFYLWINGEFVGYAEDTFTQSEFDITSYLQDGENKIAVEVYKWCSGSWLEDQDFWELSGIFRDVYLYSHPKVHVEDMFVKTDLDSKYKNALVRNIMQITNPHNIRSSISFELYDAEENKVGETKEIAAKDGEIKLSLEVLGANLWSAEKPYLYTMYIHLKDSEGKTIEIIPQKVGIKKFEIVDRIMEINGKRIMLKGVNRHEFSSENGRALTRDEMLWDAKFLKRNNFNAVRLSHYPNHPYWYELCDEYGLYVIDETNIESHGSWKEAMVSLIDSEHIVPHNKPEWTENVLDRGKSMLEKNKNHPSIIMWSCGNESFSGGNLYKLSEYFRERDGSRLVHYEGVSLNYNNVYPEERIDATSDVESRMYAKTIDIEEYLNNDPQKPFMLCEYSHAMGNSNGGMYKYTDLEEKYPMYQGGFIWDYIDQGIKTQDRYGRDYIAFGGDFGDRPTDYNLCINGLVYANRRPSPKVQEVKYLYQDFKLIVDRNKVKIKNKSLFTNTSKFKLLWKLKKEGHIILEGSLNSNVEPLKEDTIMLPIPKQGDKGEYSVDVSLVLKKDEKWADIGHEVAFGQYIYEVEGEEQEKTQKPINLIHGAENIGVKGEGFHVLLSTVVGAPVSLKYAGKQMIHHSIKPNFWRAPTDNDRGSKMGPKDAEWKIASLYAQATNIDVKEDKYSLTVKYTYDLLTTPKTYCDVLYRVFGNGEIKVKMQYDGYEDLPNIPAFGLTWKLSADYENLEWYGNGPNENYIDRNHGARLGIFKNKVVDNVSEYVIPQESGNKTGVRWGKITDNQGFGLEVSSKDNIEINVSPYTAHELENAYHPYDLPPIHHTVINVFGKQMGVGGDNSWGATAHPEHLIHSSQPIEFEFTINQTSK